MSAEDNQIPFQEQELDPNQLYQLLAAYFNDSDLRDLCFDLRVDYEKDLKAGNTRDKMRSLPIVLQQRRRLTELALLIQKKRPHIPLHAFGVMAGGNSPYMGLRYFDVDDASLFFGREALTQELLDYLLPETSSQPLPTFLAVVGASGSGKSSVVRAGLLPALRQQKNWPSLIITPTATPLETLALAFTRDSESVTATETLIDDLKASPRALHLYIRRLLVDEPSDTRYLLLIDQFEELFTLCKDEAERQAFIANLTTAVDAGPTTIIITLRGDFYNQCLKYESLLHLLETQQKIVGPMGYAELRASIELPAQRRNLNLQEGLVDLILRDLGASETQPPEPGALPLLSHALLATWGRREGNQLTLNGYTDAGGVQGAIAKTADATYAQLSDTDKAITRNIFMRLTELGEGTQDTRRRAGMDELLPEGSGKEAIETVLKTLADARLIATNEGGVDVAHEALIREWPALRGWLDGNRETLRVHRQLTDAAKGWQANQRDPSYLYRGARLDGALDLRQLPDAHLSQWEQEFITASQEQQERELAEAEARAEREADAARKLRQRAVFLRGALLVAAALAVISILLLIQSQNNAADAKRQAHLSLIQSVAALSGLVYERDQDAELAILLGLEAANMNAQAQGNAGWLIDSTLRPILETHGYYRDTLSGHESSVLSVAFSPDGAWLASGSDDRTIRLWDMGDPTAEPVVLSGHESSVWSVAFSPDGAWLASGSPDSTIRLWDMGDPTAEPVVLSGHESSVLSVAFSPDGAWLASGSDDRTIRLWDMGDPTAEPVVLSGHEDWVRSVAFSPDGAWLASGSPDSTIRLWDMGDPTAEPVVLSGHEDWVGSVAFSPDGAWLASGSDDRTIRLWDMGDPTAEPVVLSGHESIVRSVAFSPDGAWLASGSDDSIIRLWDMGDPTAEPVVLSGHESIVRSVAFSPDGAWLASGSDDRTIRLWDMGDPTAEPVVLSGHESIVRSVAFSPDGAWLASGSDDSIIRLWDMGDPTAEPVVLSGHESSVLSVAFSPDGAWLASGSDDSTIRLWDMGDPTAEPVVLSGHESIVWSVAFSPDGAWLASGSNDRTIRLWDMGDPTAEPVVLSGHESRVWSVAFSPDGAWLASGSDDSIIRLWDMGDPTAEPVVLSGHESSVWSVAFSPDGAWLASGSDDSTIRLWDMGDPTAEPVVLSGHESIVWSVAFSPDGAWLASGSNDRTIRLWDMGDPTAEPVVLSGHESIVRSVAFSPDGAWLASGSSDSTIRLWLILDELILFGCQNVGRNLNWDEWQQYLPSEPYRQTCPALPRHPSVPPDG